jgi:hypothetical protein
MSLLFGWVRCAGAPAWASPTSASLWWRSSPVLCGGQMTPRWWLAAGIDQEARERGANAVGVKRLGAPDQLADALEVVEQRELPGGSSHSPQS